MVTISKIFQNYMETTNNNYCICWTKRLHPCFSNFCGYVFVEFPMSFIFRFCQKIQEEDSDGYYSTRNGFR